MFTVPIGNQALFLIRNILIGIVTLKPEVFPTTKQANRTSEKYGKESSLSLAEFFNSFLNQGSPLKFKMSVICCQISFKIAFSLGPCFFSVCTKWNFCHNCSTGIFLGNFFSSELSSANETLELVLSKLGLGRDLEWGAKTPFWFRFASKMIVLKTISWTTNELKALFGLGDKNYP